MPFFRSPESSRFVRRSAVFGTALFVGSVLFPSPSSKAQAKPGAAQLTIEPKEIVSPVSPMLYGMMTEEINHAFDGGLYAEMVQNRTFRGTWEGVQHWDLVRKGDAVAEYKAVKNDGPSKALNNSQKLTVTTASPGNEAGLSNTGYWGMGLKPRTEYKGSFYAKVEDAAIGPVMARLVSDNTGAVVAEAKVDVKTGGWAQYTYAMTTTAAANGSANHLELVVAHPGTISFQLVSLFPPTFNNQPNGFRPELMERMAALHPHFLRLPGGNYLEGDTLKDWFNWKETIGPIVDRPGHQAPWTYWSTDGMGLYEMLEWCEDLHIEPVLAVYAGYSLRHVHVDPGKDLQPYVDAAVDEVEFLTGDSSTKWGAERAKLGHPAPFPLHYIEIGNEDWFDTSGSYDGRFAQIAKALRKKYGTKYQLIATTPVKEKDSEAQPDVLDEHYYKPVGEMLDFAHHYDKQERTGPKIFVGEWATLAGTPTPTFGGALADAAFMTGMERNSDLIVMASYAPLFINVNPGAGQWYTNMIGYDASKTYGSPSFYAQSLFGAHIGDGTAKSSLTGAGDRFYYSATVGSKDQVLHLKLVNASTDAQPLSINLSGAKGTATMSSLHAATYEATNSIEHPDSIKPVTSTVKVGSGSWSHNVPAMTIEVIDVPLR